MVRAKSVKVQKENTVIVDGAGDKDAIAGKNRTDPRLRSRRQHLSLIKKNYRKDLQRLAGGVAVIRVGAATETEMKEAKLRMEDALKCNKSSSRRRNHCRWWICIHPCIQRSCQNLADTLGR